MWHIHAMGYCSAIKRNEVLLQAKTQMNHKNIMLSERHQTQKVTKCTIPFYIQYPKQGNPETECRLAAARGQGGRMAGKLLCNGNGLSLGW